MATVGAWIDLTLALNLKLIVPETERFIPQVFRAARDSRRMRGIPGGEVTAQYYVQRKTLSNFP